jgi:hypothetical protein
MDNASQVPKVLERSRVGPDLATNAQEEKVSFFSSNSYEPSFVHAELPTPEAIAQNVVRHDYNHVAKSVLDSVIDKFGSDTRFFDENYGERISVETARARVMDYLDELSDTKMQLRDIIDVKFDPNLSSYAAMCKRNGQYTLWINSSSSNSFMREHGLTCLLDHEIGTHFCRMRNDSMQCWSGSAAKRKTYGMKPWGAGRCDVQTEEGFASVNTSLGCKHKHLWFPCLLYYCASMAATMSFRELYSHMVTYVADDAERWSLVLRAKGYQGVDSEGFAVNGWGKDQAYLEGAIYVLKRFRSINSVRSLYWGKVTFKDITSVKVKRMVNNSLTFPRFFRDETSLAYLAQLKQIFLQNHLGEISDDFDFEGVVGVRNSAVKQAQLRARGGRGRQQLGHGIKSSGGDATSAVGVGDVRVGTESNMRRVKMQQPKNMEMGAVEMGAPEPEAEPPVFDGEIAVLG